MARSVALVALLAFSLVTPVYAQTPASDLLTLRWHHPLEPAALRVQLGDLPPILVDGPFPASSASDPIETTVEAPLGCYVTRAEARAPDGTWSAVSVPAKALCTEIGRYDDNGDGRVTTADFPAFVRAAFR